MQRGSRNITDFTATFIFAVFWFYSNLTNKTNLTLEGFILKYDRHQLLRRRRVIHAYMLIGSLSQVRFSGRLHLILSYLLSLTIYIYRFYPLIFLTIKPTLSTFPVVGNWRTQRKPTTFASVDERLFVAVTDLSTKTSQRSLSKINIHHYFLKRSIIITKVVYLRICHNVHKKAFHGLPALTVVLPLGPI